MANETFDTIEETEPATFADSGAAQRIGRLKHDLLSGHSNLMPAAMFLVGVAAVFVLRMNVQPQTASADQNKTDIQIDSAITMLNSKVWTADKGKETAQIVETFTGQTKHKQIPVWKLSGNPFVFKKPKPREKRQALAPPTGFRRAPEATSEEERFAAALAAVRELSLQSVLMGPSGAVAMISDNLLAEGTKVSGWTVAEIRPRTVVLTWKDRRHLLRGAGRVRQCLAAE